MEGIPLSRLRRMILFLVLLIPIIIPMPLTCAQSQNPVPSYEDWLKNTRLDFISDSLLVGTSDHLNNIAPYATVGATAGRPMVSDEEEWRDNDAISLTRRARTPVVFIAMGTDKPVSMDEVNALISATFEESQVVKNIVFITSGSNTENKNVYNSNIKNVASDNQHVYIIDWDEMVASKGYNNFYEKDGKYLLRPDEYYQFILENTYKQMVENMPLVSKEEFVDIPFPESVKFNPSLEDGKKEVVQEGERGSKLVKLTYNTFMGMPVGSPVVEESVIREPVPQITQVGRGVEEESVVEEVKVLAFDTVYKENPQLDQGVTRVIQAGVPGSMSIKKTSVIIDNTAQGEPIVEEKILSEPVDEIIEVGTGQKEVKTEEQMIDIPFETKKIEDSLMLKGEEVVAQEGIPGKKQVTIKTPYFNGQVSGNPVKEEKVIQEPQTEIIKVGTADKKEDVIDVNREEEEPTQSPIGLIIGSIVFIGVAFVGIFMYNKFNQ